MRYLIIIFLNIKFQNYNKKILYIKAYFLLLLKIKFKFIYNIFYY